MKTDVIVAEIGSTTTVLTAFHNIHTDNPVILGQGMAETTVIQGDVTIGLKNALKDLKSYLGTEELDYGEFFATSSAAGGLKMSVHGLVYDMTVKAAKEAALGAGANIVNITAGRLNRFELEKVKSGNVNIIMIAGGVDYGERETAVENARGIASLRLNIPVIFAGNIAARDEVREIFREYEQEEFLYITENVYPKIDVLNVASAREVIQEVFEKHITKAPGMEKIREIVNEAIMPTPGAVMEATMLLSETLGNVMTVDIGGATTDVHSVAEDNPEIARILISPEPRAKRTVEGDLGLYLNKNNVAHTIGRGNLMRKLRIDEAELGALIDTLPPLPAPRHMALVRELASYCLNAAVSRHAGKIASVFTAHGKTKTATGKDLTDIAYVIGTGGALTRHPDRVNIIRAMLDRVDPDSLKPSSAAKILIDSDYIMAATGVLSRKYKEAALKLLKNSLTEE